MADGNYLEYSKRYRFSLHPTWLTNFFYHHSSNTQIVEGILLVALSFGFFFDARLLIHVVALFSSSGLMNCVYSRIVSAQRRAIVGVDNTN